MSVHSYHDLLAHVGHRVCCVEYGDGTHATNVALECRTCGEILLDFDTPSEPDKPVTHQGCGGVVAWDAEVDSTGTLFGPYQHSRCLICGAENPTVEGV